MLQSVSKEEEEIDSLGSVECDADKSTLEQKLRACNIEEIDIKSIESKIKEHVNDIIQLMLVEIDLSREC